MVAALGFIMVGLLAWATALFGPPLMALWFWYSLRTRLGGWVVHFLFLVCAGAMEWTAMRGIFCAAHDDGEGPPGLGLLLVFPIAMFVGAVALYYVAVAWILMQSIWRTTKLR